MNILRKTMPPALLIFFVYSTAMLARPANAESLVPISAQFEFEKTEDAAAKLCTIMLIILNLPSPESMNFRFMVVTGKGNGQQFVGFTMDVGDHVFVNGVPASLRPASLLSGEFLSASFASPGRLNGGPTGDGGIQMSTTDISTMTAFLSAFLRGGFAVQFTRADSGMPRSYAISEAPPPAVKKDMLDCLRQ